MAYSYNSGNTYKPLFQLLKTSMASDAANAKKAAYQSALDASPDGTAAMPKSASASPSLGTLASAAAIGAGIGNGIGQAVGSYITAKGQAASYRAQAGISENNAYFAQLGVEQAFKAGEAEIAQIGFRQSETKARQRLAYAANGIAIGVGSSAEAMASTDINAEVDKIQAKANALANAWGYRRERMMSFAQAKGARIMARAATSVGRVQMVAGLASTALSAWAGYAGA